MDKCLAYALVGEPVPLGVLLVGFSVHKVFVPFVPTHHVDHPVTPFIPAIDGVQAFNNVS